MREDTTTTVPGAFEHWGDYPDLLYKRWELDSDTDEERGEVRKKSYTAFNVDTGELVDLDLSPYGSVSPRTFCQLVDLEFPRRDVIGSIGPLSAAQIELLWLKQYGGVNPTTE